MVHVLSGHHQRPRQDAVRRYAFADRLCGRRKAGRHVGKASRAHLRADITVHIVVQRPGLALALHLHKGGPRSSVHESGHYQLMLQTPCRSCLELAGPREHCREADAGGHLELGRVFAQDPVSAATPCRHRRQQRPCGH